MRSLLLKADQPPGDVVMLTAAIRDLHHCYPGQFQVAVETQVPQLFENNRHVVPVEMLDDRREIIDCSYGLWASFANKVPVHFLGGYIHDLNVKLGLNIRLTRQHGDIHLSPRERSLPLQMNDAPELPDKYWLLLSGGKKDITIKWWPQDYYQSVVDQLRGRIRFVQVGALDDHHPRIDGTIDLRGKTSLRDLIQLVYHAQGVLCPVTLAMHLAAAVPLKDGRTGGRPCVVVAGGREPHTWASYPHHQFIHTVGALWCCTRGGCWKIRIKPLGDGGFQDRSDALCVDVEDDFPRCMRLIKPETVVEKIEWYYKGGLLKYD